MIENEINEYYSGRVEVVNSADLVAQSLKSLLNEKSLLNNGEKDIDHFYVSDFTESFQKSSEKFFGKAIRLEKYQLWS